MNYGEWKYTNFLWLLWMYHRSGLSFTDWDAFCIQQWNEHNRKVSLS